MVKVKKAINLQPTTAAPLKKTIKKKKDVAKKVVAAVGTEKTHKSLVAKKATKLPVQKDKSAKKPKLAKLAVNVQTKNKGKVENPQSKKAKKNQKPASPQKQKKKQKSKGKPELAEVPIKLTISTEDLPEFNAEDFQNVVNLANIKKIAESLKTVVEEEVKTKKNSLFTDYQYHLNVACFKIPDCPKRMVKLNLKYSIVNKEDDEVLIVVPDLQRGSKVDYEPTIEHYTELFQELGVTDLGYRLKIMPFNQLRKEYKTFEALRKLAASYEHFLCEGRIVGHAVGFVGKIFQKPRTTFHAVHLDRKDKIKERIQKALCRTAYKQLHKGNLISIPVGTHLLNAQKLAENVELIVEQLKENYPGGWQNIRNMHLRIGIVGTTALPIFISNCAPPTHTPYVLGTKEKHLLKLKREANAVLEEFDLNKKGELKKLTKTDKKNKQKTLDLKRAMMEDKSKKRKQDKNALEESVNVTEDVGRPAKRAKVLEHDKALEKTADKSKKKASKVELVEKNNKKSTKSEKVVVKQNEDEDDDDDDKEDAVEEIAADLVEDDEDDDDDDEGDVSDDEEDDDDDE